MKKLKEDLEFMKKLLIKAITMFGFTYFSTALTTKSLTDFTTPLIAAGLYFFTELMRYYKLQPEKKVLANSKTKMYNFLI